QAEDGIRDGHVTGVQTCALPICDTLCVAQVETIGMRMLLKRARSLAREQSYSAEALNSLEDLAQLLALWRPGAYAKDREQAYFEDRKSTRLNSSHVAISYAVFCL